MAALGASPAWGGGCDCCQDGFNYLLFFKDCGEKVATYLGETGRNKYTSRIEHLDNLEARKEDKSVLWLQSIYLQIDVMSHTQ